MNEIGRKYEEKAAELLEKQGYFILERNYRCKQGEIDLIGKEGEYLCFIEVKYRSGLSYGSPLEAVTKAKQRKISRTALYYLTKEGYPEDTPCRFDVVGISSDRAELIRNAFEYQK